MISLYVFLSQGLKSTLRPIVSQARSRSDPQLASPKSVAAAKTTSQRSSPNPPPVQKPIDLLTDQPVGADPPRSHSPEPLLLGEPPAAQATTVKDSIMSLYSVQPGYTAQGYAVNSYYRQQQRQQQQAALLMQQQQQMRSQVVAVQQQMNQLRMQQHSRPGTASQAPSFAQPMGGQTLNPQLW